MLQPDADRAAKFTSMVQPKDLVALSAQGVKVVSILMSELNKILTRGSKLYRKYAGIEGKYGAVDWIESSHMAAKVQAKEFTSRESICQPDPRPRVHRRRSACLRSRSLPMKSWGSL